MDMNLKRKIFRKMLRNDLSLKIPSKRRRKRKKYP
jgi:hypothetical protein